MMNHLKRLELTLSIGCKLNCLYCPQELLISNYGKGKKTLSFDDFVVVVSKIAKGGWTIFNGMSEPFLNKDCIKMLQYANEGGYNISMATTLVGLKEENLDKLKEIKFRGFILHIPDKEGNSKFLITAEYLRILKWVCDNIHITGFSCHGEVHPLVKEVIATSIPLFNKMGDRAGNLPFVKTDKNEIGEKEKIICAAGKWKTGWIPEMLPDGRVVLCCNDYGMKHVLGNIIEQEWDEVVHGDEFQKVVLAMNGGGKREEVLCKNCDSIMLWDRLDCFSASNMLWPVAIERAIQIEKIREGKGGSEVLQKIAEAKAICVWGLGRYFREDFFQNGWDEILKPQYFTDTNITEEMKTELGERCVEVEKIINKRDLLVVIYVKDSESIEKVLDEYSIRYVRIHDIYMNL